MKTITEETAATQVPAAEEQPKASKKATAGARRAPVAPKTGKAGKKATPAKKATKGAKKAKVAEAAKPEARTGSKTARILELLKRPGGVTAKELMKLHLAPPLNSPAADTEECRDFVVGALHAVQLLKWHRMAENGGVLIFLRGLTCSVNHCSYKTCWP